MTFELLRQLEDSGFILLKTETGALLEPSLDALIKACGENFACLCQHVERSIWESITKIEKDKSTVRGLGATPQEAVASMYIAWINGIKP